MSGGRLLRGAGVGQVRRLLQGACGGCVVTPACGHACQWAGTGTATVINRLRQLADQVTNKRVSDSHNTYEVHPVNFVV